MESKEQKCDVKNDISTQSPLNEEDSKTKQDDDDFSWGGCLFVLVLIIAAVWALVHYNPSEEKHKDAIEDVYVEAVSDGFSPSAGSLRALRNIKYHSLGVLSWTTTKYMGHTQVTSVGAVGFVYPTVRFVSF